MKLPKEVIHELRVHPDKSAALDVRSTTGTQADWLGHHGQTGGKGSEAKELAERVLEMFKEELEAAQELLYASDTWAVLLIFQALDAAGKDGTIKHVMSGVNPQGCEVFAFKQPSAEELRHDFLWRSARALPERGRIGIFNRSYYEEVLVVRVHPELLAAQRLPPGSTAGTQMWHERYEDINAFERHLVRNGTRIVKLFLHVSRDEQRRRFLDRLDDPDKRWKFSPADLTERAQFATYQQAYEEALTATSTQWAPWYVVPADHKPTMRALVSGIIVDAIDGLHLHLPAVDQRQAAAYDEARQELLSEQSSETAAG
ncbi:MAG: polyphosphate kinase 2 family protein [Acidimicrobiales bacterium]